MGWIEIWENRIPLVEGFVLTLALSGLSIVTSTVLGFLIAMAQRAQLPVVEQIIQVYLWIFRGSPLLLQLLFIFYGAAYLGFGVNAFGAVIVGLTLYMASYIAEVFRAGFESVPVGQIEAAKTLGMSRFTVLRDVLFPQTLTVVLAPLFGQYIALVKYTSLASIIGFSDLLRQGQAITARIGYPFEVFFVVGVLYFLISYVLSLAAKYFEKRASRGKVARA